jgi:hypothetical protein
MSDARLDDSLIYDEHDEKRSVSQDCYEDLKHAGLVEQYPCWRTKTQGDMHGVILLGLSDTSRHKVFVKRYPKVAKPYEGVILDYAVFAIMKKCGGRTPKVELKATDKYTYLFSTHMSHSPRTHVDRQYWFKIFYRNKLTIDSDTCTLSITKDLFGQGSEFKLDKVEITRTLLLGVIFNAVDFHHGNLGMVVSSEGVAKLGLVDFLVRPHKFKIQSDFTVLEFVRSIYNTVWTFPRLHQLMATLAEEDCVNAFKKVDANFYRACDEILTSIDGMDIKILVQKAELVAALEVWKANYEEIKRCIQRPVKSYIYGL